MGHKSLILPFAVLASFAAHSQTSISSTFDTGIDGWTCSGDGWASWNGGAQALQGNDANVSGSFYCQAPAKFLGNRTTSFSGTLSYTLNLSAANGVVDGTPDIEIDGSGLVLVVKIPLPVPGANSVSVRLDTTTAWRLSTLGGALATNTDIKNCLANITAIKLRAEFSSALQDTDLLDTVVMTRPLSSTLSGKLFLQNSMGAFLPAGYLRLRQAGTATVLYSYLLTPAADNTYSYDDIPAGTYDLAYEFSGFLRGLVTNLAFVGGSGWTVHIGLFAGDANCSNNIDVFDLNQVFSNFGMAGNP